MRSIVLTIILSLFLETFCSSVPSSSEVHGSILELISSPVSGSSKTLGKRSPVGRSPARKIADFMMAPVVAANVRATVMGANDELDLLAGDYERAGNVSITLIKIS